MADVHTGNGRREARLLLATIAVSVLMLLLLAQFRFPEEAARPTVEPAPAPLERLAARATYDELAGIMADLERRLSPSITAIRQQSDAGASWVPAVRMASDRAIAVMPTGAQLTSTATGAAPAILNRFARRDLVVVQVPSGASAVPSASTTGRPGPRYVAVLEATARGPVVRPVYIGRTDVLTDPKWPEPLLSVGAVQQVVPVGSAIFSLDGGFMGLVSGSGTDVTVVPADTLRTLVGSAPTSLSTRGALPFDVQRLTPALARATRAQSGVIVSYVRPPARSPVAVTPGDVIQSLDGTAIASVTEFRQAVESRPPGTSLTLSVVRQGQPLTVTMATIDAAAAADAAGDDPGLTMRSVPRIGAEVVAVQPGTAAARAGLRRGDLVVSMNGKPAPSASELSTAIRSLEQDQALVLTVDRGGDHVVLAVEQP
jgi:S1-C subfamily serine protease